MNDKKHQNTALINMAELLQKISERNLELEAEVDRMKAVINKTETTRIDELKAELEEGVDQLKCCGNCAKHTYCHEEKSIYGLCIQWQPK